VPGEDVDTLRCGASALQACSVAKSPSLVEEDRVPGPENGQQD